MHDLEHRVRKLEREVNIQTWIILFQSAVLAALAWVEAVAK